MGPDHGPDGLTRPERRTRREGGLEPKLGVGRKDTKDQKRR